MRDVAKCKERVIQQGADTPTECPHFTAPLALGASLSYQGGCMIYTAPTLFEDGVYGKLILKDGVIIGVEKDDAALYTPAPCAPNPDSCGGSGGSGGITPSPASNNLFSLDSQGRGLALLHTRAGEGISILGNGTASDPLVIKNTLHDNESTYIVSANSLIKVSGEGTQTEPYVIEHKTGQSINALGFRFDAGGHLESYTPDTSSTLVKGVVGGKGIDATNDINTGVVTVSKAVPPNPINGSYDFGNKSVTFVDSEVTAINTSFNTTAGAYRTGDYVLTVNESGSITNIENVASMLEVSTSGTKIFTDTDDEIRTMTFTINKDSAIRVEYFGVMPEGFGLKVDGLFIPGIVFAKDPDSTGTVSPTAFKPYHFMALPPAHYSAGAHTIDFTANTPFTAVGYGVVTLTSIIT